MHERTLFEGDIVRLDMGFLIIPDRWLLYNRRRVGIVISANFKLVARPIETKEIVEVKWLDSGSSADYCTEHLALYLPSSSSK